MILTQRFCALIFLSTLSLRRATPCSRAASMMALFLSTLSLRRATSTFRKPSGFHAISIHALLAESDPVLLFSQVPVPDFYPRSPCGERHVYKEANFPGFAISIHALLAESDYVFAAGNKAGAISIHALLAESDLSPILILGLSPKFLSTLSLRRATGIIWRHIIRCRISIHALLAESDTIFAVRPYDAPIFLSTLSLRRATLILPSRFTRSAFLSTLSLRRATYGRINDISRLIFLSTLSLRRATGQEWQHCQRYTISIHALLAESDCMSKVVQYRQ